MEKREKITKRQKELLEFIYQFISSSGYPPTYEEMREKLNVSSNQSIIDLLTKLETGGFIKKQEGTARGITILPLGYETLSKPKTAPILGLVSAGYLTETIEIAGGFRELPGGEVSQSMGDVFLLKISGDSMINVGIEDGDLVLVEERKEFSSGDIVLAQIREEATVKRFISNDEPPFVYLKPENPKYKNIPFTSEMEMKGRVMSVFKNGQWKMVK